MVSPLHCTEIASPRSAIEDLADKKIRELSVNDRVIILGDFNFPANSENIFTGLMESSGFNQLIDRLTHDSGGTIDHLYVRNVTVRHFLHPLYFSDHSAISVMIE